MTDNPLAPARNLRGVTIAVEGGSFAGKTTLAAALSQRLGGVMIPEYAELAPLPPFPPRDHNDVRAALAHLCAVEARRWALARRVGARQVVFDRSPLSCIAFQYSMRRLKVPCDHRRAVAVFTAAAARGLIAPPDIYVYLHIDHDLALARQRIRGPVLPCLIDPGAVVDMDRVSRRFLSRLPRSRRLILDGSLPMTALLAQAAAFAAIKRADGADPGVDWSCLLDSPADMPEPTGQLRR